MCRKEAVLSSQIEGTRSSLSDLLRFERDDAPGVPFEDVVEVSNHVAALEHGMRRLGEDLPLCNRLIREMHEVLLSRGRGSGKSPGDFRRSQNWIGGTRPGNAAFVPPPHTAVPDCMAALERFIHAADGLPVLIRTGLAHVQFETIHPFLDGNGRVGRLLIALMLCDAGVLRQPLLYLSLYLKQHRGDYYDLLNHVRRTGDWEAWIAFFLEGVRTTAEGAVATSHRLVEMFASDRAEMERRAGRRAGSVLRVHRRTEAASDSVPDGGCRPHDGLVSDRRFRDAVPGGTGNRARADRTVPQSAVCLRPVPFHPRRGNRGSLMSRAPGSCQSVRSRCARPAAAVRAGVRRAGGAA